MGEAAEGSQERRHARGMLLSSAIDAARAGIEAQRWLDEEAGQWALDAVSQRDVDAIVAMAWRE